jgi:hypothetical protein
MIVYRLHCSNGHGFEGWFASGEAYSSQRAGGHVACPTCDDRAVEKLPSAPYVNTGTRAGETKPAAVADKPVPPELAEALARLKAHVLASTQDVGRRFPEVARRIHYGEEEHRGVRGRVTAEEAVELVEEGIDAMPLPPWWGIDEPAH